MPTSLGTSIKSRLQKVKGTGGVIVERIFHPQSKEKVTQQILVFEPGGGEVLVDEKKKKKKSLLKIFFLLQEEGA